MFAKLLVLIPFLLWAAAWMIGGYLVAHHVFHLRRERLIIGISLGLVLQLWFSNWMAYLMPVPYSFWVGAGVVFSLGLVTGWPFTKQNWRGVFLVSAAQVVVLVFLFFLFFSIGRGLNIFDDFQNLPVTSIMAAGDIPPHFPFDPKLRFGYHYLLLLFSAQLMRLGDLFPWTSMDAARALPLALLTILVYLWTRRMTRSQIAGFLGALFVAFSGGARWLLLVLPPFITEKISQHITLMGSGTSTAPDLASGLTSIWKIEGDGPIQFPFAYANGINVPTTMAHGGIGVLGVLVLLLLIVLFRRLHDTRSGSILVALLASYALTGEYTFLIVYPSLGLILLIYWIRTRSFRVPLSLRPTTSTPLSASLIVAAVSLAFALFQGGVVTEIVRGLFAAPGEAESFHTFSFAFSLPTIVSAHLGFMNLLNPYQLIAALFEMGPVFLVLPLLFVWGFKMVRAYNWWEAGVAASAALSIFSFFVKYTGTAGESANTRLFATLFLPPTLYAVPLVWAWLKGRSEPLKVVAFSIGLISVFGGLVFFGIQLVAAQRPTLPVFINEMDARMGNRYWDQLPEDAMVFDPEARRGVTVFGRGSDALVAWTPKPEWDVLFENPDPYKLHAAGYDYLYFGVDYWDKLSVEDQQGLQDACVKIVDEVQGTRAPDDFRKDFRRLLDLSACARP